MKILAIDTATEQCSVALRVDGSTISREIVTPRGHAELVMPMIDEVMRAATMRLAELDGIAFGRGPGAFTGVRIAAGVVQGLALGSGLPVVGISNLRAVAQQEQCSGSVLVCMDARMGEVYWGIYRPDDMDLMQPLVAERVSAPADVVVPDSGIGAARGTGFKAHPALVERYAATLAIHPDALPHAREIALLAEPLLRQGAGTSAAEALPTYLRDQVTFVQPR